MTLHFWTMDGASDRLLAAAPILMLVQVLLLPVFLWAFIGPDVAATIGRGLTLRRFPSVRR